MLRIYISRVYISTRYTLLYKSVLRSNTLQSIDYVYTLRIQRSYILNIEIQRSYISQIEQRSYSILYKTRSQTQSKRLAQLISIIREQSLSLLLDQRLLVQRPIEQLQQGKRFHFSKLQQALKLKKFLSSTRNLTSTSLGLIKLLQSLAWINGCSGFYSLTAGICKRVVDKVIDLSGNVVLSFGYQSSLTAAKINFSSFSSS